MTTDDIVIYVTERNDMYRILYEIRKPIPADIVERINTRLLKSFSLGGTYVDARTRVAARQKANLMQMIFKNEFGYTSNIVENYT